ncbi:dipicolinate synthase subunit B [Ruminococcus sp. FC2018]|uniref:dipicolinate synthase subunit B n=1 Tax=Ruminococcus sp. FC2018 TaxID=1410617 RepID=UPI00048E8C5A|nr:dipicolinate synthase subunit B [Ruminococcus sp. FC2018]
MSLKDIRVGYCICGSFCTFEKSFKAAGELTAMGAKLIPVMSFNSATLDTRFGSARDNIARFEQIAGTSVIKTIVDAEPIGPKKMCDIMVVAPCTANTLAKLALGITDTPVTMAVKSHLRNAGPVVIAVSTNDALAGCAKNIGMLQNLKNYYFVPYKQDDYEKKPNSIVADFTLLPQTLDAALSRKQLQPVIL